MTTWEVTGSEVIGEECGHRGTIPSWRTTLAGLQGAQVLAGAQGVGGAGHRLYGHGPAAAGHFAERVPVYTIR